MHNKMRPPLRVWRLASSGTLSSTTSSRAYPATRVRLKSKASTRLYNTTHPLHEYPKEGVFQPNSPTRNTSQPTHSRQRAQASSPHYSPEPPPPPPPPSPRNSTSLIFTWSTRILISLASALFGFTYLTTEGLTRAPLPFEPGSPEDHEELQLLAEEHDSLPLVQDLRALFHTNPSSNSRERVWKEWVAYRGLSDPTSTDASVERRENGLSTGPLKGSQGLAAQSVFYNDSTGQVIVFVNFGEGTCGWPGVVHGGAIATVMDESLGRVCAKSVARDVSAARNTLDRDSENVKDRSIVTAQLDLKYTEQVEPGQWFVLMTQLGEGSGHPDVKEEVVEYDPEAAHVETSFTGLTGVRSQRGFSKSKSTSPSSEPVVNTGTPLNPTVPTAEATLGTEAPALPPGRKSPAQAKGQSSIVENDAELELGFRKSTDWKKYALGLLFCASEAGPNLDDIEKFMNAPEDTGEEEQKAIVEGSLGVHVHAIGMGLFVVKEEMRPPPEEL